MVREVRLPQKRTIDGVHLNWSMKEFVISRRVSQRYFGLSEETLLVDSPISNVPALPFHLRAVRLHFLLLFPVSWGKTRRVRPGGEFQFKVEKGTLAGIQRAPCIRDNGGVDLTLLNSAVDLVGLTKKKGNKRYEVCLLSKSVCKLLCIFFLFALHENENGTPNGTTCTSVHGLKPASYIVQCK